MEVGTYLNLTPNEFIQTPVWFIDGVQQRLNKIQEDGKRPLSLMELYVYRGINRAFGAYR